MNRRKALQILTALPAVASIEVAALKPNAVIVIECDLKLSDDMRDAITSSLQRVWPDQKIVIFDEGIHMRVARNAVHA